MSSVSMNAIQNQIWLNLHYMKAYILHPKISMHILYTVL